MRFLSLLLLGALALFGNACEKHPLAGDPHPGLHEEHGAEKHDAKTPEHTEVAKPSESSAKGEEAPKFFPEKK